MNEHKGSELVSTLARVLAEGGIYVSAFDAVAGTFEVEMPDERRYLITVAPLA